MHCSLSPGEKLASQRTPALVPKMRHGLMTCPVFFILASNFRGLPCWPNLEAMLTRNFVNVRPLDPTSAATVHVPSRFIGAPTVDERRRMITSPYRRIFFFP